MTTTSIASSVASRLQDALDTYTHTHCQMQHQQLIAKTAERYCLPSVTDAEWKKPEVKKLRWVYKSLNTGMCICQPYLCNYACMHGMHVSIACVSVPAAVCMHTQNIRCTCE